MLFREFIEELNKREMITRIDREVNPDLEISRIIGTYRDRPLMFSNVKGSNFSLISNVLSTRKLLSIGLGINEKDILRVLIDSIEDPKRPRLKGKRDYIEISPDLDIFPIPKFYPNDGGRYITAGIAVIDDRDYGLNASYHRAMVLDKDRIVMRVLPRDFYRYVERGNRRFAFTIGNPVSVMISSAISVDIGLSELDIANALYPIDLIDFDGIPAPEAEIVMVCRMTDESAIEGPFVDITHTMDIKREQPVAKIEKIYIRDDAVFHSILPAGYEHRLIMGLPRESTIYREVSKICDVIDVSLTPGGCSWLHGVVSIKKHNEDDGKKAIEAAFRGHKSMKHVFVVDDDIDIRDPNQIEWAMATRFQGDRDMIIKKEKGSSLDPSANPVTRETTKIGFDLTIPMERDRSLFRRADE